MNIGRKRRRSGGEESSLLDLFQAGDQYYGFAVFFKKQNKICKKSMH